MKLADAQDAGVGPFDVDITIAPPKSHGPSCFFHDPRAEILVRNKEQIALGRSGLDNFDGVATGANDVA